MPKTLSYRLAPAEYARYLSERDDLARMPGHVESAMTSLRANYGAWQVDGTHASASYDAGYYWVRTVRPIDWV
jgi:hypothetical protein